MIPNLGIILPRPYLKVSKHEDNNIRNTNTNNVPNVTE